MKTTGRITFSLLAGCFLALSAAAWADSTLDAVGVTQLRALDPSLTGSGVSVAQVEAPFGSSTAFEVNPSAVGQSPSLFIYTSTAATSTSAPPNAAGTESSHADTVGDAFYGMLNTGSPEGVAYGVSKVYNYEAGDFFNNYVNSSTAIVPKIVSQSFVFTTGTDTSTQAQIQAAYDSYAVKYNTLFISGAGDGGPILSPASSYNGIAVGDHINGGATSDGPTYDGRAKPDITAPSPGEATSYSTPYVSGAAALLVQAGTRGDGGVGTATAATDARTVKALLLNGAVKESDWTQSATVSGSAAYSPLDPRYGAGVLNACNSYLNLKAGQVIATGSLSGGPVAQPGGVTYRPSEGWDLGTLKNGGNQFSGYTAETAFYAFNLSDSVAPSFTLTSTLTWFKQSGGLDNLYLYLYNTDTGTLVGRQSDSTVDNVQELYDQNLAPGHYALEVEKAGGTSSTFGGPVIQASETYALAFNFAPVPEPASLSLLLLAVPAFFMGRRRSRS